MIKIYQKNDNNDLKCISKIEKNAWIDMVNPTEEEIKLVSSTCSINVNSIKNVLDEQETSRVEKEENSTLIIVDIPYIEDHKRKNKYQTIPLGIIITNDYLITVSLKENEILQKLTTYFNTIDINKKTRFTIQMLYVASFSYINDLKIINKEMIAKEKNMSKATKNEELLVFLDIEKSLVYFLTSLKGNGLVLNKILKNQILPLFEEDTSLLEDTIIENEQGIEMTIIYREILSSTSHTYGTMISNNLNILMKFLAGITIIFSVPTMIASFIGMNVKLGIIATSDYSFIIIIVISLLISLILAYYLKKKDML